VPNNRVIALFNLTNAYQRVSFESDYPELNAITQLAPWEYKIITQ
jgi:hypothetical protein